MRCDDGAITGEEQMTKRCDFQCPDSGLIVVVEETRRGYKAYGDEIDWDDMQADEDAKASTREWIEKANARLAGAETVQQVEAVLKRLGCDPSDCNSLYW